MEKSFIAFVEKSIKEHWDLDALTDYKGATLQYKDVARKIEKLHILLAESGIKPGDKVAVCGRNSSHWGVAFLAILTYGAVAVPILHEFKADNIHNIVNHSEARLLFVGDMVWEALNEAEMPLLEGIILMTDFTLLVCRSKQLEYAREHLNELFGKKFPRNFRREHVAYRRDEPEELAVINYTSGTTSFSKGVMLPYRSLWSNTQFAFEVLPLKPGDRVVSMLPMAHMYGLAFEFLYEFASGCHVFFLTRMPSPKIIFQAFSEVKPHIVIAVPLIIEKIIKKKRLAQTGNAQDEDAAEGSHHQRQDKSRCTRANDQRLRRQFLRGHRGRRRLQSGSGKAAEEYRLPLYRRIRNDRMWTDYLLRRLETFPYGLVRKGRSAHGSTH